MTDYAPPVRVCCGQPHWGLICPHHKPYCQITWTQEGHLDDRALVCTCGHQRI